MKKEKWRVDEYFSGEWVLGGAPIEEFSKDELTWMKLGFMYAEPVRWRGRNRWWRMVRVR